VALMALGVRMLSVNPEALLRTRRLVQCVSMDGLTAIADKVLGAASGEVVKAVVKEELIRQNVPQPLWQAELGAVNL